MAQKRKRGVEDQSMNVNEVSGETLKIIQQKIKEDNFSRQESLEHIKEWLRKSPHLPDEYEDERILTFLRGCKYSMEKCKSKLDMYFTVRTILPHYFTNRDIKRPELQDVIKDTKVVVLPSISPEGYRLSIMKGPDQNAKAPDVLNLIKVLIMNADVRLAVECVASDIYIADLLTVKAKHLMNITVPLLRDLITIGLKAHPFKIKQIHVINVAPWLETTYKVARSLLPTKMQNRVYFHSDINGLYDHIPKELLPNEYGGKIGSINDLHENWIQTIDSYTDWFKEQENIRSNEALRLDNSVNFDELFGIQGSFRQLTID